MCSRCVLFNHGLPGTLTTLRAFAAVPSCVFATMPAPCHSRAVNATRALLDWYDAAGVALPWRERGTAPDPYRVWLSEIMLQQTTIAAVRPYFARFVERWATVATLSAARDEDVMSAWAGLGSGFGHLTARQVTVGSMSASWQGRVKSRRLWLPDAEQQVSAVEPRVREVVPLRSVAP